MLDAYWSISLLLIHGMELKSIVANQIEYLAKKYLFLPSNYF